MSALAVYLEREGIATVLVGLVRLHIEKVMPPRALWVPFELGRPLGGPGQSDFAQRVMRSALGLLERSDGPVILEDFPDDDPGAIADASWAAPDLGAAASIEEEIDLLREANQQAGKRYGSSQVGLSGMSIKDAGRYLQGFDTDSPMANPGDDMSDLLRMRFSADDIRSYYCEAAAAQGDPTSVQIYTWFWQTRAAQEILRIRAANKDSDNNTRSIVCGKLLVPGAYAPAA